MYGALLTVAAIAYLFAGLFLLGLGVAFARRNALDDAQYFQLTVSPRYSMGIVAAKIAFVAFWLPLLAAYLSLLALRTMLRPKNAMLA